MKGVVSTWLLPVCSACVLLLSGMAYKSHAGATKGPAPQDFEITTQSQLQSACYDQPGLCLITMLDGRSDTANKHRWATTNTMVCCVASETAIPDGRLLDPAYSAFYMHSFISVCAALPSILSQVGATCVATHSQSLAGATGHDAPHLHT